jgi:RHS repeat-associated protein
LRNANYIVHQKIALMQMRQAVLICYLQILRRFLINYASSTQFVYDAAGNLQTKTDREQKATSYEYDALNRLTKVTDGIGQTEYTYDNRDNLIALTDAKGQTTTFAYDRNNRLISEKRPLGQQTGYQYNALGQLTKKTDAKNQTSVYTYDNAGRMTQIVQTDAANNTKTINFTYDDAGNLLTYNDGTTSGAYTYDNLYRKTQETTNYGAFSLTTSYSYNQNGTKKTFTYPNGTTIGYTYDANNQPLGINIPGAGSVAYNQYQWTRPQSVTLPDGGTSQYAYDELMRTKAITAKDYAQNPQMNYAYTYDKMDNIKTRNTQAGNYAYNYDNLYRLNEVKKDTAQTEAYTYDQVGNRLTSAATTGNWTYDANNELLSLPGVNGQSSPATYQYDANGNTIQKSVNGQIQNYVYNADNRLIEVKDAGNNTIAKYTYDPFGRRIKKSVSPAGGGQGVETYYLYSDEGLIGEYDSAGTEIKTYGYKPNSRWSTDPVFMKQGANYYFYHNDHLGTPQKMTNLSGAIVWQATYDAFGKATVDAASSITSNLRFPGQYFDAETGLHYNWNRYYDPNTGRYVTEDPIGLIQMTNRYTYVENRPINYIDPEGKILVQVGEAVVIGIGVYYIYKFYRAVEKASKAGDAIQELEKRKDKAWRDNNCDLALTLEYAIRDLRQKGISTVWDILENLPPGTSLSGLPSSSIEDLAVDDIVRILTDYYASMRKRNKNK